MDPPLSVLQTAMLQPGGPGVPGGATEQAVQEITIRLDPPDKDTLFRLESEQAWRERMRQEAYDRTPREKITFPDEPVISTEPYYGRNWQPRPLVVEPTYVGYRRLLFEEKNSERYGWDLGPLQIFVSGAAFYKDVVMLPYHIMTDPLRCYEYNTGYCLPGDPVPYYVYPPELSASGGLGEAAAIGALLAIFP